MNRKRRDPYGSRGSKFAPSEKTLEEKEVEILMDLVDLNGTIITYFYIAIRRDPYGSRGSK